MFRVFCTANIFLGIVIFKMTTSSQESLSHANCQLTNTCFERTTDDLGNERSTTPKIADKETTANTKTPTGTSENAAILASHSPVSLQAVDVPSTKGTRNDMITHEFSTAPYTTKPISTATQLTKRKSQTTNEVAEESTVAMTTVEALKSTQASKPSEAYTISSVWTIHHSACSAKDVVKVKDLIYVVCRINYARLYTMHREGDIIYPREDLALFTYEDCMPYDLLMITIIEEIEYPMNMLAIETTLNLYVQDIKCNCIWKIDTVNNKVDKWMSDVGSWSRLSVTNDNHLLVVKDSEYPLYLEIYDQDAKFVRSVSLPNDFRGPFHAIQKPNGEFIVSHYLQENYEVCVSFLSADGQIISQLRIKEAVKFRIWEQIKVTFFDTYVYSEKTFATEMVSGKVYMRDEITRKYSPTDLSLTISNDSEGRSLKIVGLRNSDGRIIKEYTYLAYTQ